MRNVEGKEDNEESGWRRRRKARRERMRDLELGVPLLVSNRDLLGAELVTLSHCGVQDGQ